MNDRPDDPFALDDAAYVLGALPPPQREAFERHLQRCPACRESVARLAGLPGLLRAVPPEVAVAVAAYPDAEGDDAGQAPAGLLEGVLDEVARRRRRRWATVLTAAAAAVVLAAAVLVPRLSQEPEAVPAAGDVQVVALEQVVPGPLSVTARLAAVDWGTRIELLCEYTSAGGGAGYRTPPTYSLVLEAADGELQQVATWRAVPGRTVTIETATALPAGRIAHIEVLRGDVPVLRAAT